MSFINTYKEPEGPPKVDISFREPYDINSAIPIPPTLQTDRVRLVPFVPAIHAEEFYSSYSKHPEIERHLPLQWSTQEKFLIFLETFIRQKEDSVLFAIIDNTKTSNNPKIPEGRIAGVIGWLHGSSQSLSVEIGPVIILPEFQRTFVSTNAAGLLLKYFLDLPSQGGLGYRRVVWCASPLNDASVSAAEKLGFEKEGTMRWTWVLPEGKEGRKMDGDGRGSADGRDSVVLSICWDAWESHVRDLVTKRMERV